MKKDELNILADKYYSVMDISDEKKEKRKKDAWELFDLFMLFFLWFKEAEENNVEDNSYFLPRLQNELQEVVSSITFVDDYLISYLATIALGIYTATVAHLNEKYYLSEDRAANLAFNESNTINNYIDTKDAEKEGYTHKKWVAQLDERTRLEHIMMDGAIVPIDGYFVFSDCRMFAPHDVVNGTANQVANCRCSLKYLILKESGASMGAYLTDETDPFNRERERIGKQLYDEIKNRKKEYEIKAVAKNSGYSEEEVSRVYDHVFIRDHLFSDGSIKTFDEDYDMAQSWFRLRNNDNIQEHDRMLIKHELEEERIMGDRLDIPYEEAHNKVEEMGYSYSKLLLEYKKRLKG